jgi:hypothetical protein
MAHVATWIGEAVQDAVRQHNAWVGEVSGGVYHHFARA